MNFLLTCKMNSAHRRWAWASRSGSSRGVPWCRACEAVLHTCYPTCFHRLEICNEHSVFLSSNRPLDRIFQWSSEYSRKTRRTSCVRMQTAPGCPSAARGNVLLRVYRLGSAGADWACADAPAHCASTPGECENAIRVYIDLSRCVPCVNRLSWFISSCMCNLHVYV